MSTHPTDLYAVLGLLPDASTAQVSHAYRARLREHHQTPRTIEHAHQAAASDIALQQILCADAVLGDAGRRAEYDTRTRANAPDVAHSDPDPPSWKSTPHRPTAHPGRTRALAHQPAPTPPRAGFRVVLSTPSPRAAPITQLVKRSRIHCAVCEAAKLDISTTAAEVVRLHGGLVQRFITETQSRKLTSFASKYLHFHCDTVPIYDDRARHQVRIELQKYDLRSQRKELAGLLSDTGGCDPAYWGFVAQFLSLKAEIERVKHPAPSVKEIDHFLWYRREAERR